MPSCGTVSHLPSREELDSPIDPALVSQRKGRAGKTFSYIEGHTVIDEANRVFGYGGWGYELVGDVALREIDSVDAKTGEIRRIRAYAATVRVTVLGAPPRMDVGFHAVVEDNADGHETAIKGSRHGRPQASPPLLRGAVRELALRRCAERDRRGRSSRKPRVQGSWTASASVSSNWAASRGSRTTKSPPPYAPGRARVSTN